MYFTLVCDRQLLVDIAQEVMASKLKVVLSFSVRKVKNAKSLHTVIFIWAAATFIWAAATFIWSGATFIWAAATLIWAAATYVFWQDTSGQPKTLQVYIAKEASGEISVLRQRKILPALGREKEKLSVPVLAVPVALDGSLRPSIFPVALAGCTTGLNIPVHVERRLVIVRCGRLRTIVHRGWTLSAWVRKWMGEEEVKWRGQTKNRNENIHAQTIQTDE